MLFGACRELLYCIGHFFKRAGKMPCGGAEGVKVTPGLSHGTLSAEKFHAHIAAKFIEFTNKNRPDFTAAADVRAATSTFIQTFNGNDAQHSRTLDRFAQTGDGGSILIGN